MTKYASKPSFVISESEFDEILAPWVFEIKGEQYAFNSINSFSLDDLEKVAKEADEDVAKGLQQVAFDDKTKAFIPTLGIGILRKLFEEWTKAQELKPGESDGSEK